MHGLNAPNKGCTINVIQNLVARFKNSDLDVSNRHQDDVATVSANENIRRANENVIKSELASSDIPKCTLHKEIIVSSG